MSKEERMHRLTRSQRRRRRGVQPRFVERYRALATNAVKDFSRMHRTAVPLLRSLRRSSVFAINATTKEHCLPEDGQTVAHIIF